MGHFNYSCFALLSLAIACGNTEGSEGDAGTRLDALTRDSLAADVAPDETDVEGVDTVDKDAFTPSFFVLDQFVGTPVAGPGIQNSDNAINGIGGTTDVFSMGYDDDNRSITLTSDRAFFDQPGDDFIVFENGFVVGENANFMDQIVVSVSDDGVDFVEFPHDYVATDERSYSDDPRLWLGFAGVTPTRWLSNEGGDPFAIDSGGDSFDLEILQPIAPDMLRAGIRFIRLRAAHTVVNPDTGEVFPKAPVSNGPDVDGVIVRSPSQ